MKDLCYKYLLDFDKKEYKKWAFGIQDCGYATDKKYALKLIHFIENHRLFELDQ
jgi:flagellum-specific peptidoglycan hydrolase FlgJ